MGVNRRPEPVEAENSVADAAYGPDNEPPKVTMTREIVKYVISMLSV